MQTVDTRKYVEGIFVQELKNRFLCEVLIDNVSTVCYVPSSCHLGNFLSLHGKTVLLSPTYASDARTKYALFAVPYKRSFILLNTSIANRVIEANIQRRVFAALGSRKEVYAEHCVDGYKADLYIDDTKTVIEVKSVLSLDPVALFPTVYSERSIKQLVELRELLANGYNVHYCIVSLNPYINSIQLLRNSKFYPELKACVSLGMTVGGYACRFQNGSILLKSTLPIVF